jgi:hypothetical protein
MAHLALKKYAEIDRILSACSDSYPGKYSVLSRENGMGCTFTTYQVGAELALVALLVSVVSGDWDVAHFTDLPAILKPSVSKIDFEGEVVDVQTVLDQFVCVCDVDNWCKMMTRILECAVVPSIVIRTFRDMD